MKGLASGVTKADLADAFADYDVVEIWLADASRDYGFVTVGARAREAIRALDGSELKGRRITVELQAGKEASSGAYRQQPASDGGSSHQRGGDRPDYGGNEEYGYGHGGGSTAGAALFSGGYQRADGPSYEYGHGYDHGQAGGGGGGWPTAGATAAVYGGYGGGSGADGFHRVVPDDGRHRSSETMRYMRRSWSRSRSRSRDRRPEKKKSASSSAAAENKPAATLASEIRELKALHEDGALDGLEFKQAKAAAMAKYARR